MTGDDVPTEKHAELGAGPPGWDTRGSQRAMSVTGDEMIVNHPRRLHEGVTNRRADECEAAFFEIFC